MNTNFMEGANNNNNKKRSDDDDDYYGEEDRFTTTTTTTTTSSSASPQGGGGGMTDPKLLFSSTTNWPNSSPSSSTTAALAPPNLYQQYNTRGGFIRGTISPSPSPSQQQQQLDLMDTAFPSVVVREREHMFDKVVTPSDVGKLNRLVIPKQHAEKYFPLDSASQDKGLLLNFEDVSTSKLWRFRYSYWNSSQSYVMTKGWSRFVKDKKLDPGDIVSFLRDRHKIDHLFIDCTHRPPQPQYHHHLLPFPSNPNPNINTNNNNMNFPLHPRYAINNSSLGHMGYWSTNGPPGGLFLPVHAATPYRGGERERERGGDLYYHDPLLTRQNPNYRTNTTTGYNNNNNYYGASGKSLNDYYTHIHQQQRRQEEEEEEGSSSSYGTMRRHLSLAGGREIGIRELGVEHGQQQQQQQEVLLHSVPVLVVQAAPAAATSIVNNKRLRLFGVNMDCPISDYAEEEDTTILPSTTTTIGHHNNNTNNNNAAVLMPPPSTSLPHLVQLRLNNNNNNNINNNDN